MEGLEISEIPYSRVLDGNFTQRFDSEYFKKEYLNYKENIEKQKYYYLESDELGVGKVSGGKRLPLGEEFSDKGIPYIRAQDIKNGFVDSQQSPKISEALHQKLKRYETQDKDTLITIVGNSIGDVGFVRKSKEKWNLTENAVRVMSEKLLPEYVFGFLLSKYGQAQIRREVVGTAQPKLAIERIRNFEIPSLSGNFQNKIKRLVYVSHCREEKSDFVFKEVERELLENIGITDFTPYQEEVNIKSFKGSFLESGRLDAEYYQPKYEKLMSKLEAQPHDSLENLVKIKKSIEPGSDAYSDEGLPFIRVSDFNKFGLSKPDRYLSDKYVNENMVKITGLYPKNETILFSKDGSVGTAYLLNEDIKAVTSGAILHLNVKDKSKILPEYLTLVLNSKAVQMQAERDAGGSIILHWRLEEIKKVAIPIIPLETQQSISEKVQESFSLRKQSEHLLEVVKRAVEIAIESNESEAIKHIKKEVGDYVEL